MARRRTSAPQPITIDAANARIAELRKHHVPTAGEPEDLTRPIDPDVRMTANGHANRLELIVGGKAMSWLTVLDFQQQIGSQTVRMGGIAGVGTDASARFQGLSRRLIANSIRWMRQAGFDTTMLYGIGSYYPKFGYAPAFPYTSICLTLRDAETVATGGFKVGPLDAEKHLPAVLDMYHRGNAGLTGVTLREAGWWRPERRGASWQTKALWRGVTDRRGRLAGYILYDSAFPAATILEVGFATRAVFPDVARFAAGLALEQRLEQIRLLLPEDHDFVEYCKPLGLRLERQYRRDGWAMVRMINSLTALQKAAPELGPPMRGSGAMTIRTNMDAAGLSWRAGRLTVASGPVAGPRVTMPQWALAQLLYGYRKAGALADAGVIKAPPAAVAALEEMFPLRPHHHYAVDEF